MAIRPVFIPRFDGPDFSVTKDIDFQWFPGMSKSQKQKSIRSLHQSAQNEGVSNLLEISSKSEMLLGVQLSAFNLMIETKKLKKKFTVETAFQASKVFEKGGPYVDLLGFDSRAAKKDIRLKESGNLTSFQFYNSIWSLKPRTAFYDWLYLSALAQNSELAECLMEYTGFTDIEFNPEKSINCQARSAALFVSLKTRGVLEAALSSQDSFLKELSSHYGLENIPVQSTLI
ncbi:TPA: DarT1-associated NADAR antitoxin family protein [Yersinia enterocolitica]